MKFKITNNSTFTIQISDLGIILQSGEFTFLDNIRENAVTESTELRSLIESETIEVFLDDIKSNYYNFLLAWTKLTGAEHEAIPTLVHNLANNRNFMTRTKDANGKTYLITYFTDSSLTQKVREEEIIRDSNGKSAQIIERQYDFSGLLVETETSSINRTAQGTVDSIEMVKS